MKNDSLPPLHPGDIALRVRVAPLGPLFSAGAMRCRVLGLEAVEVLRVNGDSITWTNHKPCKFYAGDRFRHTCDRRELLAVSSLESLSAVPDEKSAVSLSMAGAGAV